MRIEAIKISFPRMGDYDRPISRLLQDIFPFAEIISPPPMTQKTIELGSRNSPDFICSPFKYNIGNFIEVLEAGANVLFQTGTGCRYGYFGEVQEKILHDLGYDFEFICLSRGKTQLISIYRTFQKINPNLRWHIFLGALWMAMQRIRVMDKLEYMLRERIGFECKKGSFERAKKCMLTELMDSNTPTEIQETLRKYSEVYRNIEVRMPENPLRVGIVGELFTVMEPFSNHYLEKELAKSGIIVSRDMSVSFLLFGKTDRALLRHTKGYLRHAVGANGLDSILQCKKYAQKGYDGVVHMKSSGCTPELNAQPALMNLSRDWDIPVLYLSFDTQTSETGIQTRIEAFTDMIKMKRERCHERRT